MMAFHRQGLPTGHCVPGRYWDLKRNRSTVGHADQALVPPSLVTWGSFLPTHVPLATLSLPLLSSQSHQQRGVRQQRTGRIKFPAKLSGSPFAASAMTCQTLQLLGLCKVKMRRNWPKAGLKQWMRVNCGGGCRTDPGLGENLHVWRCSIDQSRL